MEFRQCLQCFRCTISKPSLLTLCVMGIVYILSRNIHLISFLRNLKDENTLHDWQEIHKDNYLRDLTRFNKHQIQTNGNDTMPETVNVMIVFSNAKHYIELQNKFQTMVRSMFRFSSRPLIIYIIGDEASQDLAKDILSSTPSSVRYKVVSVNITSVVNKVHSFIKQMQIFFSGRPGSYYSDALFSLSTVIHTFMPRTLRRVIFLDVDLKFNSDISALYMHFSKFSVENIIGVARENQPIYRHIFNAYRQKHVDTKVGEPPPDGITGFNSGVLLLDLDSMRNSTLYNALLNKETISRLTSKYLFNGHLGDQDFFSLLSVDFSDLFYVLPCTWNRQMCTWWRDHGYKSVFDAYYICVGHIDIYHGNCNSSIPKLGWEIDQD